MESIVKAEDRPVNTLVGEKSQENQAITNVVPYPRQIAVSLFNRFTDNVPRKKVVTWEAFASEIVGVQHKHWTEPKANAPAFSPAEYPDGVLRAKGNVLSVQLGVLDYDSITWDELRKIYKALDGTRALVYTSYSHTTVAPRVRVVIDLDRPVPAAQWPAFWTALAASLPGTPDDKCKDASRIYGLPYTPNLEDAAIDVFEGEPLKVGDYLKSGCNTDEPETAEPTPADDVPTVIDAGNFERAVTLAAKHWAAPGSRHEIALAWAGVLLRGGLTDDQASEFITAAAKRAGDEEADKRAAEAVPTTRAKIEVHDPVYGLPTLLGFVPQEAAYKIIDLLGATVLDQSNPMHAARRFIGIRYMHEGQRTLHFFDGAFYAWDGASYSQVDIVPDVYLLLEKAKCRVKNKVKPFLPNRAKVGEVAAATQAITNLGLKATVPMWLGEAPVPASEILACTNGLLDLRTRTMLPHRPDFLNLNALPFAFEPSASEPREWLRFLDQQWSDDPQAIETLQEIFGYLLTPDTRQQKIFLIVGPKRSGKGTIGRVLSALLGADNVASPTLASLQRDFGLQPLIGKRLGLIADARLSGRADQSAIAERLLSVSGEDMQTIDRKHISAWSGRLQVRFLMLTNELPRIADTSGALASRFVALTMQRSFYGQEDQGLFDRLQGELPAILNWALAGLDRLRKRGYFIQPKSSADAIQELEDLSSPVAAFVRERCVKGNGCKVTCDRLYVEWKRWCGEQGRDFTGNAQTFGRDIRAVVPQLVITKPTNPTTKQQERTYQGIGLKA